MKRKFGKFPSEPWQFATSFPVNPAAAAVAGTLALPLAAGETATADWAS